MTDIRSADLTFILEHSSTLQLYADIFLLRCFPFASLKRQDIEKIQILNSLLGYGNIPSLPLFNLPVSFLLLRKIQSHQ